MTHTDCPTSIVVGIDGSEAAVRAAQWAVDEAMSRDLPLRLVHIIEPGSEAVRLENEYAQIALETARDAVELLSRRVRVQTAIKRGGIDAVLARESRTAELICIGAAATESLDERSGGSTSATLARSAQCPVVVVGLTDEADGAESGCVAVIVDGSDSDDLMLRDALEEARIRKCSLLAVNVRASTPDDPRHDAFDQRMAEWERSYPDVGVHCVTVRTDVVAFLAQIARSVSMTIVSGTNSDGGARFVDPGRDRVMLDPPTHRELSLVPAGGAHSGRQRQTSPGSDSVDVLQRSAPGGRIPQ